MDMTKATGLVRTALRWIGLAAIIGLFVLAILNGGSGLKKGSKAPPVVGIKLDGERVVLSTFAGKPTVINFWATWCPPCLAELPEFEHAYQKYKGRVEFIGVAMESGQPAQVADMAKRFRLSYPIVLGVPEVSQAYKVSSFPTTFILDAQGTIVRTHANAIDLKILERDLDPLL